MDPPSPSPWWPIFKRPLLVHFNTTSDSGLILPSMGKERQAQPYAYSSIEYYPGTKKPIPGGVQLVRFDTNFFKNKLASILEVKFGDPGCWYYNNELSGEWATQMTVEGINPDTQLWENPRERPNHAWDCSVLILLAAEILGVKFWQRPQPAAKSKKDEEPHDKPGGGWREDKSFERPSWLRSR